MHARLAAGLVALLAWTAGPAALAACGGANMLAELARTDPAAHAAILAEARAVPNGTGRFWRIERPGTAPSHIFGTFHTGQAIATVPEAAWAALDGARVAVAEMSADEMAAMEARIATDPGFAFDPEGGTLSSRLSPDQLATVGRVLATRGVPLAAADRMRPWLLYSLLGFPACHLAAVQAGEKMLDAAIIERATAAGIPHVGLEDHGAVVDAFRGIPADGLVAALVASGALIEREEDVFRTTFDLYAEGRIAAIEKFGLWLTSLPPGGPQAAAFQKELLDALGTRRNLAWLPGLERELSGGNAFVAVGALHLPGPEGLIELLRARGWTVTAAD